MNRACTPCKDIAGCITEMMTQPVARQSRRSSRKNLSKAAM